MSKLKSRQGLSSDQAHEIREAFELFDINKDSKLDYHQLKVAIRALGFDLKKAEVLKLLREFNSSDGLIPFDSFHRISQSARSVQRTPSPYSRVIHSGEDDPR